ncbi:MAG: hypothetical protein JW974_02415 [Alphaproteobacteria bacterium]|nr:hypothetical protein [Alphaproteobacteria bacterium]MBN2675617.1 hypothetical protein [Alphaproteobacteria bacterium]
MDKKCIFCGENVNEKTKEHVIPQWLIELTGNPKRNMLIGVLEDNFKTKQFAFDQFTFPACYHCNNKFSNLESLSKKVIEKILNNECVNAQELSILLDWFDKVRIGLWLGSLYLSGKYDKINPHLFIDMRVGYTDRALIIEKDNTPDKKINFVGIDTPVFHGMPSVFQLRINNFIFTNMSTVGLVSRRLGFPFSETAVIVNSERNVLDIKAGLERIIKPVIRKLNNDNEKLIIFQPMFGSILDFQDKKTNNFYNNNYVKSHSLDFDKGIGGIFINKKDNETFYLDPNDSILIDPVITKKKPMELAAKTLELQNVLFSDFLKFNYEDKDHEKELKKNKRIALEINKVLISNSKKV